MRGTRPGPELNPAASSAGIDGDVNAAEDPDNQAGECDPGQPAAMRVGVLADEAVAREGDVTGRGESPMVRRPA